MIKLIASFYCMGVELVFENICASRLFVYYDRYMFKNVVFDLLVVNDYYMRQ